MKRSDIGVVIVFYGICLFFFLLTRNLPAEAQTYPLAIISGLCILNTLYLLKNILSLRILGLQNDLRELFSGFQTRQFFGVVFGCILYITALPILGFYLASVCFLIACMLFLKVPKLHILLTLLTLAVLIFVVFTLFLKVPLPVGTLFS